MVLLCVGALVVLAIIGAIAGAAGSKGKHGQSTAAASAAKSSSPAAPTPTASPLTASQQKFIADMHSTYNVDKSVTDQILAVLGNSICGEREDGDSQSTVTAFVAGELTTQPAAVTLMAERDMCPRYVPPPPKPKVIARFNGSGIENTPAFTTGSDWHLSWSYWACDGGEGNFAVTEENTDGSDDFNGVNVNELGTGRGPVATYAYDDAGRHYFSVDSECSWSLAVVSAG